MTAFLWAGAHVVTLLFLPILMVGLINRTKSLWSGRRGQPLLQLWWDLARLLKKQPVYSTVTTPVFRIAPSVVLGTTLVTGLVVPLLGQGAPLSFAFDAVFLAYAWGLGRLALMLGALDTGSAFEGMGASREATYAALVEPVLFVVIGTLAAATGATRFQGLLSLHVGEPSAIVIWVGCVVALLVILQVEAARIPVDDPNTHLELTMIHEVMILDHSGPDLAALQAASALKLTLCAAAVATLLNPLPAGPARAVANVGLTLAVAVVVGTIESVIARLKLRALPQYVAVALAAAAVALLSTTWHVGGGQ